MAASSQATPSGEIMFDAEKFRETLLHIAERSAEDPSFGATKLNKTLFFADFRAYQELGTPITGATYQRLVNGPAPRELLPQQAVLRAAGDAHIETRPRFNFPQKRLVADRSPNLARFSPEEKDILEQIIDALRPYTATEVSELSHELAFGWCLADDGEDIPYYTAYLTGEPPTDEVLGWARELADVGLPGR